MTTCWYFFLSKRLRNKDNKKVIQLFEAILALTGICIFSLFIHRDSLLIIIAFIGLILTALSINNAFYNLQSPGLIFGITPFYKKVIYYSITGFLFGGILGILYRYTNGNSILPATLTKIAIVAPIIGIAEELVFRGFIQGRAGIFGPSFSVIFAAAGHTLYKYLVLKLLPVDIGINFLLLIILTMVVGIILGILREVSKNVIPPSLAHACFDILVYGGLSTAPVWVWF